jgi:DNA-binding IclR family transcriptional regulator
MAVVFEERRSYVSGGRRAGTQRTVLGRALAILQCFSVEEPALRLVDIGRRAGLPLSTVVRLASELCERGVLERRPDLRYRIGPEVRRWAAVADVQLPPLSAVAATA